MGAAVAAKLEVPRTIFVKRCRPVAGK